MIKRSHIRQFLALVEVGSFTLAAKRIRVTQPTLSAGIAELEKLVGTQLFIRNRKGVRLTDCGGTFLPIARDLEHRFRQADAFGNDRPQSSHLLRVGTIRTISASALQLVVAQLAKSFAIELAEGTDYELRSGLAEGRFDVALTILRPNEEGPNIFPAFEEDYRMLAAAHHELVGRDLVRPDELASETMIARRSCEALNETSRFFTRNGVRPRFAFKSDNDDRCMRLVAAGLGITTAPMSLAVDNVRPINVEGYNFSRRVGAILNADDHSKTHSDASVEITNSLRNILIT